MIFAEIRAFCVIVFNIVGSILVAKGIIDQPHKDQVTGLASDIIAGIIFVMVSSHSLRQVILFSKKQASKNITHSHPLTTQAEYDTSSVGTNYPS